MEKKGYASYMKTRVRLKRQVMLKKIGYVKEDKLYENLNPPQFCMSLSLLSFFICLFLCHFN